MNPNKKYYGDTRLNHFCAFCGCPTETEDHVPSICFLDKPNPQDLPVIPCCYKCNHDFSLDEEYVSCMIDCMKAGTASPILVKREKTRKSLLHNPKLQERISSQIRDFGGVLLILRRNDLRKSFVSWHSVIWLLRMIRLYGIAPIVLTFICCLRCLILRGTIFSALIEVNYCQKCAVMAWNM